ncbi:hypothetical protein AB0I28_09320 [Phytomonospora sp. NPDC050363]|uniref:hypothetical protein n=1 Tax=Phytomonospora sp. NPDC050363 TaxID=3155642 RepID=UPI0033F75958
MNVAAAVLTVALGAIFTFVVDWNVGAFDLSIVGLTLMVGGVIWARYLLSGESHRRAVRHSALGRK